MREVFAGLSAGVEDARNAVVFVHFGVDFSAAEQNFDLAPPHAQFPDASADLKREVGEEAEGPAAAVVPGAACAGALAGGKAAAA